MLRWGLGLSMGPHLPRPVKPAVPSGSVGVAADEAFASPGGMPETLVSLGASVGLPPKCRNLTGIARTHGAPEPWPSFYLGSRSGVGCSGAAYCKRTAMLPAVTKR